MTLHNIEKQLEKLYCTYETAEGISISTGISYEGNPINFLFCEENDKYARIYTNKNFSEWMAWCPDGWTEAAPKIEKIAGMYGAVWDNDTGSLYIRFRRNELTLAQAVMRLEQAVSVVGCLGED